MEDHKQVTVSLNNQADVPIVFTKWEVPVYASKHLVTTDSLHVMYCVNRDSNSS